MNKSIDWSGDSRFYKSDKGEPVGTIRQWKDGKKHQKQSDGSWKEVTGGKHNSSSKKENDNDNIKKPASKKKPSIDPDTVLNSITPDYNMLSEKLRNKFHRYSKKDGNTVAPEYKEIFKEALVAKDPEKIAEVLIDKLGKDMDKTDVHNFIAMAEHEANRPYKAKFEMLKEINNRMADAWRIVQKKMGGESGDKPTNPKNNDKDKFNKDDDKRSR